MTTYHTEVLIDFGEVGYHRRRSQFRVRLDSAPLAELIADAQNVHRVYELLLIERPGDVWDYVQVVPEALPESVVRRVGASSKTATFEDRGLGAGKLAAPISFPAFDSLFYWAGDDTEPADQAWLTQRESPVMLAFAKQLLAMVELARARIDGNDPLLRHLIEITRSGRHPYAYMQRNAAVQAGRLVPRRQPTHDEAFYRKLEKLLRDPDLVSVAYRGNGDYGILRMLATEQRRRASATGHTAGDALHLSALVNRTVDNQAWDSQIWFFQEGLAHGDLRIETQSMGGVPMRSLVEDHGRIPGRYILSVRDEGPISGFEREVGDGWCFYRADRPDSRRLAQDRIQDRRSASLGPILSFREEGATLYGHDKTVIVIGPAMVPEDLKALSDALAEWQQSGGEVTVIALGDALPLAQGAVKRLAQPGFNLLSESERAAWLYDTLQHERPWIDAMLLLKAPNWAVTVLSAVAERQSRPWSPWIVATEASSRMRVDLILEGNLEEEFIGASRRAKARRPRLC